MSSRIMMALALSGVVLTGACATGRGAAAPEDQPDALAAPDVPAVVQVSNQNWQDIDVFVLRPGIKERLGMVTSMGKTVFKLSNSMLAGTSGVRLLISPIGGGGDFLTPEIPLTQGQRLDLDVENNLRMTSYAVW